ncbi:Hypothetical predicted protein [Paramuricea clavata]|uniref:Uncharacterized protein n=1 Tax=Paramuricea clavata TaxID=317549 RepID=A0A7D9H7J2_PARCT|nr:Hypothetical predicted protein [Paramuricea clavata]
MNADTCVDVVENISMKKEEINTLETVQNWTLGHESSNDSTWQPINSITASEAVDVSETIFKPFDGNISTAEDSNLKINEHVLQQDNHPIDTRQNRTAIHESTNDSIWQSTTPGADDVPHTNDKNIPTAEYPSMIVNKHSSHESGDILLAKLNIDSDGSTKSEISDLGTSTKNNESISTNDETGNQTAVAGNEKTVNQNVTTEVLSNVENVHHDKITTKEVTDKFFEPSSSKSKNTVVEDGRHDNHHLCHVTGVDKANRGEVNHQLYNVASLAGRNHTTRHLSHGYNLACGEGIVATDQLSHVNIAASGKVNYAIFPNTCPHPGHILHKDIADDQLQRYLEDACYESESIAKETLSSFGNENQTQEMNLDDFVEISLEEKRSSNDSSIGRNQAQDTSSIQFKSHGKLCCLNKCFKRFRCTSSTKS